MKNLCRVFIRMVTTCSLFIGSVIVTSALAESWYSCAFAQVVSDETEQKIQARAAMVAAEELYSHKDYDKAIEQWREAIRLDPSLARAHHDLGMALRGKGQTAEAIPLLQKAVHLDPKNGTAYADLGDALQEQNDLDGALAAYQAALALVPKSAPVRNNLGYVFVKKGNLDGAIAEWREAARIDPQYPPAHINLGEALESKGDAQGAIAAYERFLELVTNREDVEAIRKRIAALKSGSEPQAAPEK
jgi:tetratricopeptide (TPR) repeat protein